MAVPGKKRLVFAGVGLKDQKNGCAQAEKTLGNPFYACREIPSTDAGNINWDDAKGVGMALQMHYCMQCGTKLKMKYLPSEDCEIPYCPACGDFRFPVFNTAVSMIVQNEAGDQILLIRQYGRDSYILVAGYVNKGEDAEHAAQREILEEVGLTVTSCRFNRSHYFAPSNTLMLNWTVTVADMDVKANEEIDSYQWFSVEEARANIRPGSLAQIFLEGYVTGKYPW